MSHFGVSRPAASGCSSRNHGGMGCTCVSILVASLKDRRGSVSGVEISEMEDRASVRKGNTVRSIESRAALVLMRVMQEDSTGGVTHVDVMTMLGWIREAFQKSQRLRRQECGELKPAQGLIRERFEAWVPTEPRVRPVL
jgi:hypothetical protein